MQVDAVSNATSKLIRMGTLIFSSKNIRQQKETHQADTVGVGREKKGGFSSCFAWDSPMCKTTYHSGMPETSHMLDWTHVHIIENVAARHLFEVQAASLSGSFPDSSLKSELPELKSVSVQPHR